MKNFKLTRRDALKATGVSLAASTVITSGCSKAPEEATGPRPINGIMPWSNWAGNQVCYPAERSRPRNEADLIALLKNSSGKVRAVGAGHSFSALVPTDETMLSMAQQFARSPLGVAYGKPQRRRAGV